MAEIVEKETAIFLKMDPDPFDDRHPFRVDPTCGLGHALKFIFRKDTFMTKVKHNK
jgi:HIV-1 Vpr-binding protein